VGDVVASARQREGLQGVAGEFQCPAGVAVAQQKFRAGVPDLRAFQGLTKGLRELLGLGEVAFGVIAVARAEPRSSQRVQALQDAAGVGDLTPQPERLPVMLLGGGPFILGLGDTADVGEDRAVDHAVAVGFGQACQEFQCIAEPRHGGLDIAAEIFGGGHDAMTAGAQVGIGCAAGLESRTPIALRLAEITEIQRDVRQADKHVDPLRGAAHQRHLGFSLSAVKVAAHEREL
jgi:hypothetical protein